MKIPKSCYVELQSPMSKAGQTITDESRTSFTITYRIGASRRVHMIKGVSLFLGPVLDEVQVVLGQIRVQHNHSLARETRVNHHIATTKRKEQAHQHARGAASTLSSMTCMMCRERRCSVSVNGLHLTATCNWNASRHD